jgi:hypothetical protein
MADVERILQQLHDSEINAGMQTFYDAGMRLWIGDEANGIQAETTINRTAADRLKWPEGLTAASWLHETALRLYPDSKIANMPKRTAVDRQARALCIELARVTGRPGLATPINLTAWQFPTVA